MRAFLVALKPRPAASCISSNHTVLTTGPDGFVSSTGTEGLFVNETRVVSTYRWTIDGRVPRPVSLSSITQDRWLGYYISVPPGIPPATPDMGSGHVPSEAEMTLELRLFRAVDPRGGVDEDVHLSNFSPDETRFTLALECAADFADYSEAASGARLQQGKMRLDWNEAAQQLTMAYHSEHAYDTGVERGMAGFDGDVQLRITSESRARYDSGRLLFDIRLPAHARWHASVRIWAATSAGSNEAAGIRQPAHDASVESAGVRFRSAEAQTLAPVVIGSLERARQDLAALRLFDPVSGKPGAIAAGLPTFTALFGRDALTTSWQAAMLGADTMTGALEAVTRLQGREEHPWRDEQPGRMVHEAHAGPLSTLNFIPQGRYYGSATTSGFFPFCVAELWHWTGDRALVAPFVDPALRALRWLDERSDLDGDGFYEYLSQSSQGVRHQGWKDSRDAVVDHEGRDVAPPIATCEEQAFAYAAKLHLSELLWWIDRRDEARRLFREAAELKKRFNERFWCEADGSLAMGLGPDKRPIRATTSNPGHCLAAGILDEAYVERVADTLMSPALFSGWGVRTLSNDNPAFNPYSYHRGSVWPVEQGTFAIGFVRYGLHAHAERLARGLFDAASLFEHFRLPELFSGHPRDARHPFPAWYPTANAPQAWSASTLFLIVQALLGLYPYAPLNLLIVDPHLPEWLPSLDVSGLSVGRAKVTLRFVRRSSGRTDYEVIEKVGTLHILRQPSPWSLTAGVGERFRALVSTISP
jgi:glycogen debranching enzyme